METHVTPVWLDCDPGHDDAMAIILSAYSPSIKLLGISTTFGNSPVNHTTLNACKVLYTSGIEGVDVVKGVEGPICKQDRESVSENIHGYDGLGTKNNQKFPTQTIEPLNKNAIVHMAETILKSEKKVTVVATGCYTNVALMLKTFPEVEKNIEQIVVMGGAIGYGNVTPAAEANIINDPEAADILVQSGIKFVMVPLEVTHTVLVTPEIISSIEKWNSKYSALCVGLLQFFTDAYKTVFNFDYPPLHDPCAVAYIIAPEIFEVNHCNVEIERVSPSTKGRTICDILHTTKKEKNAYVTTKINVEKFWELMLDALEIANSRSKME
jgi:purine nucleosidase